MTQMTISATRVIDPILSTVAQGYKNSALIGSALFPSVPVTQRAGKIIQFGKDGAAVTSFVTEGNDFFIPWAVITNSLLPSKIELNSKDKFASTSCNSLPNSSKSLSNLRMATLSPDFLNFTISSTASWLIVNS